MSSKCKSELLLWVFKDFIPPQQIQQMRTSICRFMYVSFPSVSMYPSRPFQCILPIPFQSILQSVSMHPSVHFNASFSPFQSTLPVRFNVSFPSRFNASFLSLTFHPSRPVSMYPFRPFQCVLSPHKKRVNENLVCAHQCLLSTYNKMIPNESLFCAYQCLSLMSLVVYETLFCTC